MKKVLVFAMLAIASMFSAAVATYERVSWVAKEVWRSCKTFVAGVFEKVSGVKWHGKLQLVRIVQAVQFHRRIEKRERPVVTSSWRMCAST